MEKVYEHCPHCDSDVLLDAEFRIQTCPNCGEKIKPCALCDMDSVKCSECKLNQLK